MTLQLPLGVQPLAVQNVIGFPVTAMPFDRQMDTIIDWAGDRLSRVVCVANVHMLMEAHTNSAFAEVLYSADIVTPDGMPLVWLMNLMRGGKQDRVAGMDILLSLCQRLPQRGISVYFVGSNQETLDSMRARLEREFPDLTIAGMEPLPFRPLTAEENQALADRINQSRAGVVFVSLGCPKQEIWMHHNRHRVQAVMIGLGGAFPVYAGIHKWAPLWIRKSGFEWLYRLAQEPRRLWKRYLSTIPPFLFLACKQVVSDRLLQRSF
ncbi:MAG TPA: WecB/TagA/CpsF family glycosyltransferase [Synechococcales cyanobacterium M55_K2018_004]|nr:WecB/TagA/CpsF family glycosyltransferase [Synechococcales cyanobacterium M55_K2018_004]